MRPGILPEFLSKDPIICNFVIKIYANAYCSQWTTAFGTPASMIGANANVLPQHSPPLYPPSSATSHPLPPVNDPISPNQHRQYSVNTNATHGPSETIQASYPSVDPSFVTSTMWRDTVASTFDPHGLKRRWDVESPFVVEPVQQKRAK